jgi:hypothetical protein
MYAQVKRLTDAHCVHRLFVAITIRRAHAKLASGDEYKRHPEAVDKV